MRLDPQTEQRIKEVFGGRACCQCGRPAARLCGGQFYCPEHFPHGGPSGPRGPRLYKHPLVRTREA